MIGPASRDRLTAAYATRMNKVDFGQRLVEVCNPLSDVGVTSVRQLDSDGSMTAICQAAVADLLRLAGSPRPSADLGRGQLSTCFRLVAVGQIFESKVGGRPYLTLASSSGDRPLYLGT